MLGESESRELFRNQLPFGASVECRRADQVKDASSSLEFPVVVKLLSPSAVHKSELGLVVVGCEDPEAAAVAAANLEDRFRDAMPDASFSFSIQQQLDGIEVAIGIKRDALGPVIMVSAGGILVELLDDRAMEIAPVGRERATRMIEDLRIGQMLAGYRGDDPKDVDALADLIVDVSELAAGLPELQELDLNPVFVGGDGCAIADIRCSLGEAPPVSPPRPSAAPALGAMFGARRIAVVGASADRSKPGGLLMRYLRHPEWPGEVVAVNRKPVELDGVVTYPSVAEIEGPVDLACIAVPAPAVAAVVEECVAAGVPAGIIFSAGFAESGEEGAELQRRVQAAAGDRFRFVGPNAIGVAAPPEHLFATFGMVLEGPEIEVGPVAFVSQSGAIASSMISRGAEYGIGYSHWISVGNEADLGVADFLEYLATDDRTSVICLFLEAIREPEAFEAACGKVRDAGKSVVAIKAGRSEAGQAAAVSHTGALVGSAEAHDAFLRRCGVVQVSSLPAMFSATVGLLAIGPVDGNRVAVASMSGGACSVLADACAEAGLEVPALSAELQQRLREVIPSFGGVRNPIDITAAGIGAPDLVRDTIEALRSSGEVDLVLLQLSTNADPGAEVMAHSLIQAADDEGKPFLVGRLGSSSLAPRALAAYRDAGMHIFTWPDQLVEAATACTALGRKD